MMASPAIDLDALLRRLHLPTVRRLYPDLAQRAEGEGLGYRDFLAVLMAEEVAHRTQTRIQRCVRRAHFPCQVESILSGKRERRMSAVHAGSCPAPGHADAPTSSRSAGLGRRPSRPAFFFSRSR